MRLENRVALITGGGRGIGRAIALAYAKEGAKLVLAARTVDELEGTAEEVRGLGAVALVYQADVTNQTEVEGLVQQTLEEYSTVDILVNSAGMAGPIGALQDNDVSDWIRTIQVNLIGTYLCCRSVLPIMLKQNRGKIINLSGSGSTSAPFHLSAYGSSKAAVIRLTEILSLELAHTNVQVNALGPGSINTRMWEQIRDDAAAVGDTELSEFGERVTRGGPTGSTTAQRRPASGPALSIADELAALQRTPRAMPHEGRAAPPVQAAPPSAPRRRRGR